QPQAGRTAIPPTGFSLSSFPPIVIEHNKMLELSMPQVNRTAAHADQRHRSDVSRRTIDLGPLPGLSGFMLRLAQLAVFGDFITACKRFDIRPVQYSVLTVIENNPGINQTELSSALAIKRANLVALIDEVEQRGLAQRRRTARD